MSSLFTKVLRQAFKTFDRSNKSSLSANLKILCQLTEQLTYRDININPDIFADDTSANRADKAPCTFVHVFESADVAMSVFILRANYTMPLHDHPMMHGILKGIYGNLLVKSYTKKPSKADSSGEGDPIYDKYATEIEVSADEPKIVSPQSECAILTPVERNFHEITAVDGVAAFFDILSPPYDSDIPVYGRRKCHFYQRVIRVDRSLVLQRIPEPLSYYCDTADAPEAIAESLNTYMEIYGGSSV